MDAKPQILIIEDDQTARSVLQRQIETHPHYAEICRVSGAEDVSEYSAIDKTMVVCAQNDGRSQTDEALQLTKPVRLGAVFDAIERLLRKAQNQPQAQPVSFGRWSLDTLHSTLIPNDKKHVQPVRLTEKERDILLLLHKNTGQSVSREMLLKTVWAYAETVETHTLETHIYRLRQKIEKDPAAPEILLTTEEGYQLVV